MAVAHDAASESHTGSTGSTNEASFSWSHNPVGAARGVLVFVFQLNNSGDDATAVTYGGASLTKVTGGMAVDSDLDENGRCTAWFLGSSVPVDDPATVVVTRTNNANILYATCYTMTASADTEVYTSGIVLLQDNGLVAEQSVNDGSPGTNSMRYCGLYWGRTVGMTPGANSTADAGTLLDLGVGTQSAASCRETAAGQGSRSVGFDMGGSSDDRAGVHLAVREVSGIPAGVLNALGSEDW